MVALFIRRTNQGLTLFNLDREHLHYVYQRLSCSPTQTLILICTITFLFPGIGVVFLVLKFLIVLVTCL